MGAEAALLAVEGLTVDAELDGRRQRLVDGVDLTLAAGESIALVGESGSGKSLTARALVGLLPPGMQAAGRMRLGEEVGELGGERGGVAARGRGRQVSLVLQDPFTSLNPVMRCGRQIAEALPLRGLSKERREAEAVRRLAEVGIADPAVARRYPFQLSGGMRQRVALAAALATDPAVLIADEFSTALDVTTQKAILELLRGVQRARGMGLILITHDLRMAFAMCDRVYVMYAGSLMEVGRPASLERRPRHPYTLSLILSEPSVDGAVRSLGAGTGAVPRADEVADRCAFAARCTWQGAACLVGRPALAELPEGGRSACVRVGEIGDELGALRADAEGTPAPRRSVAAAAAGDEEQPLLAIAELRKTFLVRRWGGRAEEVAALKGVSLALRPGESVGIVGESGSGKTTLARCVVGLEQPSGGQIVLAGADVSRWRALAGAEQARLRRTVQYVFQDPYSSLNPMKSVGATLREAVRTRGVSRPDAGRRVDELLELVGLPVAYAARKPIALSGGERQRVAIARALALEPRLLVCDEPVSALDVSVQAQVLELLARLREQLDVSYLFISHDLAVVRQVADRVVVMLRGEIVETGSAEGVLSRPSHPYTRQLVASIPGSWEPTDAAPSPAPR